MLGNYMPEACKGCVVVHGEHSRIYGKSVAIPGSMPLQWDAEDEIFIVSNASKYHTCYTFITFAGVDVFDKNGQPFQRGITRDEDGKEELVTTFVVVLKPQSAVSLGKVDTLAPGAKVSALLLAPLEEAPAPAAPLGLPEVDSSNTAGFCFPLPAATGPYLCTQGVGGLLSHFFLESLHAIDLRCAAGTPVLAIGNGVVKEIEEKHTCCSGIHMKNLNNWNALSVELDCGIVAEYVHIRAGTAWVKPGERVQAGQPLCESGDIGFAAEPHLHIELHAVADPEGPSLPLQFSSGIADFVPFAGRWYNVDGQASTGAPPLPAVDIQSLLVAALGPAPVAADGLHAK